MQEEEMPCIESHHYIPPTLLVAGVSLLDKVTLKNTMPTPALHVQSGHRIQLVKNGTAVYQFCPLSSSAVFFLFVKPPGAVH